MIGRRQAWIDAGSLVSLYHYLLVLGQLLVHPSFISSSSQVDYTDILSSSSLTLALSMKVFHFPNMCAVLQCVREEIVIVQHKQHIEKCGTS